MMRGEYSLFVITILLICFLVGLRYEVGGDWGSYLLHLLRARYIEFREIPTAGDPGYVLVNWIAVRLGGDIWLVNLTCATLFSLGLFRFVMAQPRPWLALTVAVPYLILVVAMGYTRQGVAIGIAMLGVVALGSHGSNVKFVSWVVLAATFHKSAVLLIPIAALVQKRGRVWTGFWVGSAAIVAYFTLLEDSVATLMRSYVEANYDSAGAAIRVWMNALPATILVLNRNRFPFRPQERPLFVALALLALALVPALFLSPSSTAVDRLGLYLIPLQILVLSRLPDALGGNKRARRFLSVLVIVYSAGVQFVWINYATHASYWLPYKLYPF